ncbi:uncharacterized protein EI90DRAFT_3064276, partial [Cantharellus anzutake]|uniref:uncharacterized protein n=1 Tax=Cantharellus anzutake TaxID=1750568 RepID=UPI001907F83A
MCTASCFFVSILSHFSGIYLTLTCSSLAFASIGEQHLGEGWNSHLGLVTPFYLLSRVRAIVHQHSRFEELMSTQRKALSHDVYRGQERSPFRIVL